MENFTLNQKKAIKALTENDLKTIDSALMKNATTQWRKIARIIGMTMMDLENEYKDLPDLFYGERVIDLVLNKNLVSQGDIHQMRYGEVKLP